MAAKEKIMEDPMPYIALRVTPENRVKIKKALAALKQLDEEVLQLKQSLNNFSHDHSFCSLPTEAFNHLNRLRAILANWTTSLQRMLPPTNS